MPKRLNQEEISRMVSSGDSAAGGGSGSFDPSMMAGYATQAWVNENYLSIEFFSKLFKAYDSAATPNEIVPNDIDSTITNIKAMFGFWTEQYLSALGQNSGGGGGGSSTLAGLNDVQLTSPTDGQVLKYNATLSKWVNANESGGGGGTVTSITAGTGLSGGVITTSGTIALSTETQTAIGKGETAYGWGNHANAGYATQTWVGQQGFLTSSAISDMATQTWVNTQISDMATKTWVSNNFLGINATAASATKMATARELWGQSFDGTAAVTGTLSYVGDINSNTLGSINNFNKIELNAAANAGNGGAIYFHYNGMSGRASGYIINDADGLVSVLTSTGNIGLKVGTQTGDYLQIGAVRLVYDTSNNALKVIKSDGTAANLYATGGVSALGMSAGASSIDAMTFGYVTINNEIDFSDNYVIKVNNDDMYIGDSNNDAYVRFSDMCSWDGTDNWKIETNGHAHFVRLYLDATRYLFVDSGILYYYNGSTNKQIAFTN